MPQQMWDLFLQPTISNEFLISLTKTCSNSTSKYWLCFFWFVKDAFKPCYDLFLFQNNQLPFYKKGFYCAVKPIYLLHN